MRYLGLEKIGDHSMSMNGGFADDNELI